MPPAAAEPDPQRRPASNSGPASGERLLAKIHPHPLFIVLAPMWSLLVILGGTWGLAWLWPRLAGALGAPEGAGPVWRGGLLLLGARVAWQGAVWLARDYTLTDRRIIASGGVVRRWMVEVPLARVQHTQLSRSLRERLTGLGTIGVATAGTAGVELAWVMVGHPHERLDEIRSAAGASREEGRP